MSESILLLLMFGSNTEAYLSWGFLILKPFFVKVFSIFSLVIRMLGLEETW